MNSQWTHLVEKTMMKKVVNNSLIIKAKGKDKEKNSCKINHNLKDQNFKCNLNSTSIRIKKIKKQQ